MTLAGIRQAVAGRVSGWSGWSQSTWYWQAFGLVPGSRKHKHFSVGVERTDAQPGRQRSDSGALCRSVLVLRFAYTFRGSDAVTDGDAALGAAQELIERIMVQGGGWPTSELQIQIRGLQVGLLDSTHTEQIGEIQFSVLHYLDLE